MAGDKAIDPMYQFKIYDLVPIHIGDLNLSFTNSALWAFFAVGAAILLYSFALRGGALVPDRVQSVAEGAYGFMKNTVRDAAGEEGLKYFPQIFTIFLFVFFCNMLGMLPYSFTVTSHLAVTGALALAVFITVTAIGFKKHGMHFLSFFVPKDAPGWLKPVLAVIEVISYFVRPLSHSVRLAANMVAGHAMMKVFAGFAVLLAANFGFLAGIVPLIGLWGVTALELLVCTIQAYVFAILTAIYLNDALHMH